MIHGDLSPEASFSIGAEPVFPKATGTKMEPGETVEWFMRKHMAGPSFSPWHSRGIGEAAICSVRAERALASEGGGDQELASHVWEQLFPSTALFPECLKEQMPFPQSAWVGGAGLVIH